MNARLIALTIGLTASTAGAQLTQLWNVSYDGPESHRDNISDMVVADDGSIFVCGEATIEGFYEDIMTARYDAEGNLMWMQVWVGPGECSDYGAALVIDASNNVYVAGYG